MPSVYVSEDLSKLRSALADAISGLKQRTALHHTFEFPSQFAARDASNSMASWMTAGNKGLPPDISAADYRAVIYDLARPSAQLQAYSQVVGAAILEHAEAVMEALDDGRLVIGLVALRGIYERMGALADNVRRLSIRLSDADLEFPRVIDAGELIIKTIYGTRLDWQLLAVSDMASVDPKKLPYTVRPLTADLTARGVLGGIDVLNKRVNGTRVSYEVLCEFLHPNVGDLVAATIGSEAFEDQWGTRHVRRILGVGATNLQSQFDYARVLDAVFRVAAEIIAQLSQLLGELDKIIASVSRATRKSQHNVVRKNRDMFRRSDPCPCLSGKSIRDCAPTALKT